MSDPTSLLQALFNAGAISQQSFGPESRYYGLPLLTYDAPDGTTPSYVSRRFIPSADQYGQLALYQVRLGDRIDVVAGAQLANPLSYWQICDANVVLEPDDAVAAPGGFIVIPLPPGVPG